MPNSSLLMKAKNDMLIALQNDENIIKALGINEDEDIESLIGKRMFPHWFIPNVQEMVKTYICIEAGLEAFEKRYSSATDNILYDIATIKIYVLSHQDDLYMDIAGVSGIRTDYLSCLIDEKFNGSNEYGIGTLQRISNNPFNLKDGVYRYREITFRAVDLNDGICG